MQTSNKAHPKGNKLLANNPWILAARPKTLPAAISPVLVGWGLAISMGKFSLLPAIASLFCALWIQVGANYFNDVIDYAKGTDSVDRLGPTRVTQAKLLTPRQVWTGGIFSFLLAGAAGIFLAIEAGWIVLLIGLACFAAGILYTAGPYSLSNTGLAEIFCFIFFGLVAVNGTVFVITGSLALVSWLCGIACGALITAILIVNNIRDAQSDRAVGRRNIASVFGRKAAEFQFLFLLFTAYAVPPAMILWANSRWTVLLAWFSFPFAAHLYDELVHTPISREFNRLLAKTGQLTLLFSVLLTIGFVLSLWV